MRVALLSVVLVLTAACGTLPQESQEPPASGIRVDIEIVRSGESQVSGPSVVRVWMAPIVGGIRGYPSRDSLVDVRLAEDESFDIEIDELQFHLAAVAQPAGSDPVTYDPADTRIARVGTFGMSISEPGLTYSAGFRDPQSGHGVIMIYVDRPCRIVGSTTASGGSNVRIDANLERAGLHWLVVDESEPGVSRIGAQAPGDRLLYTLKR